jgi:hypothetical protein
MIDNLNLPQTASFGAAGRYSLGNLIPALLSIDPHQFPQLLIFLSNERRVIV